MDIHHWLSLQRAVTARQTTFWVGSKNHFHYIGFANSMVFIDWVCLQNRRQNQFPERPNLPQHGH